jgi:hypothetical protein
MYMYIDIMCFDIYLFVGRIECVSLMSVFQVDMLCELVHRYQCFGGTYCDDG